MSGENKLLQCLHYCRLKLDKIRKLKIIHLIKLNNLIMFEQVRKNKK